MLLASAESTITTNPDIFSPSDFATDFIRTWGWGQVKALRSLCHGVEKLFDAVYDFLNITNSGVFLDFYNQFRPLIVISLIISLILLGQIYMHSEKRPPVIKNLMIGLMVLFATPTFIQYLNNAILTSKDYFTSDLSSTDSIIGANIVDLLYLDSIGWDISEGVTNSLDEKAILHLDAAEHVNRKNDVSSLGREIFDTKIIVKSDGKIEAGEMGVKGWFDIFDPPYYYRYKIHYVQIIVLLIIYVFVIVFASYKTFLLIQEILMSRILGALLAMELTSGQKTKKVIEGFFSAYLSLFFILVSFKLYAIIQSYINAQSYNSIVRTFLLLFAGFLVMDGPNLIEKIFGYDIGFGSGAQKFMSLMRLGMEGMQMKYFAGNLLNGGLHNALSSSNSATNNRSNAFNGMSRGDSPEPSQAPKENASYSAPEPNTSSNNSPNYNSPSGTNANAYGDDVSTNTGSQEPASGGETGFSSTVQEPSFDSGHGSGEITEPNGTKSNVSDPSSQAPHNMDNNSMSDNKGSNEDSTLGDRELLNGSNASIQEPIQNPNTGSNESMENGDSESGKTSINGNEPINSASEYNSNAQDSELKSSSYVNELPGGSTNSATNHNTQGDVNNSAVNQKNREPANGYGEQSNSRDSSNFPARSGSEDSLHNLNSDSTSLNNSQDRSSGDVPFDKGNSGAINSTNENKSSSAPYDTEKPGTYNSDNTQTSSTPFDTKSPGAINSTHDSHISSANQSNSMNAAKEQLLDKKFGTNSISPNVISPPTGRDTGSIVSGEHLDPSYNNNNDSLGNTSIGGNNERTLSSGNDDGINLQTNNGITSNDDLNTGKVNSSASSGSLNHPNDLKPNNMSAAQGTSPHSSSDPFAEKMNKPVGTNVNDNISTGLNNTAANNEGNISKGNIGKTANLQSHGDILNDNPTAEKVDSGLSSDSLKYPTNLDQNNTPLDPNPSPYMASSLSAENMSTQEEPKTISNSGKGESNNKGSNGADIQSQIPLNATDILNSPVPEPPKEGNTEKPSPKSKRGRKPVQKTDSKTTKK